MIESEDPRARVRAVGEALSRLAEDESLFDELSHALDSGERSVVDKIAKGLVPRWLEPSFCWSVIFLVPAEPPVLLRRYYWVGTGLELTPEEIAALSVQLAGGGTVLDLLVQQGIVRMEVDFALQKERLLGICIEEVAGPTY